MVAPRKFQLFFQRLTCETIIAKVLRVHLTAYIFGTHRYRLEQAASWTGRFVRVYERVPVCAGFQFSPIISNGRASRQDLSGHYSFYHFPLPPPSVLSFPLFLLLLVPSPFFSISRLPELFQSPTWEDLSSTPTSRDHRLRPAGITEKKEVSRKKKESSWGRWYATSGRGIPFPGFMSTSRARARMHVDCAARRRVGFTVISSYFTLS